MRRAAVAALALLCLAAAGTGCGSSAPSPGRADEGRLRVADPLPEGLAGRPAPRIRLADARGGAFDTRTLAGRPYLVTFLFTRCPDVCPLIGAELRQTLRALGPDARRTAVVAVSVDPRGDTPEAVRAWLARHREPRQFRYLVGEEADLRPVWEDWYAAPQLPGRPESAHTAAVWLVDARGRLAAKVSAGVPFDPHGLAADVRTLLRQTGQS